MSLKLKPLAPKPSRFKITYEASLLTLITFAISIFSIGWQTFNYFGGAKVTLIAPDQITIGASGQVEFPNRGGGPYVHFMPRMSYVNSAATGYNATIRGERLRITVEGHEPFEHQWFRFVSSDAEGPDGEKLKVERKSEAHPFVVVAGNSESHETLFQPSSKICPPSDGKCAADAYYIDWTTFIDWLEKTRRVGFEFLIDIYGRDEPVTARCRVEMTVERFADLKRLKWGSPECMPPP